MSRRRPEELARTSRPRRARAAKSATRVAAPKVPKAPGARAHTPNRARRSHDGLAVTSDLARPKRRRLLWGSLFALAVLATLALGARWILQRPYFHVQHVVISGLRHETDAQVLTASGLGAHPSMLSVNAATVRARLSKFSWIDRVRLEKHWPNTVVVQVTEATPVAVAFAQGHVLQYVDAAGRDLGVAPLRANLPTLSFQHPTKPWPYGGRGAEGAYVASRLPAAFASQVSVISENAKGDVTLKMTTPVTFVLGSATNLHAKFVAIASVIAHSTLGPGDVVDVTVPDELAVTGPAPS